MTKGARLDHDKVERLWNLGLDRRQIAERMRCTADRVSDILSLRGLTSSKAPRHHYDSMGEAGRSGAAQRIAGRT